MKRHEYERMFRFEDWYWWYRGLHELVGSEVKQLNLGRVPTILDAGCGTGRMMELLRSRGQVKGRAFGSPLARDLYPRGSTAEVDPRAMPGAPAAVEGFDFSAAAVDLCRQRGVPDCRTMDLNAWDPEADRWDVIISLDVICCSGVRDDRAILEKFHRALAGNGHLIMNLPAFPLLRRTHDLAVSIARRYRRKDLVRDLEARGFRLVYAGYRLPPLFLAVLAKKIIEKISKPRNIESDLRPLPRPFNDWLLGYHRLENRLILRGMRLPFGSSLFVVAAKNGP
ncbi:MAG: class I SAM-dependent methyltransferase [Candidatus Aminicenantes bacterium]|nr:class I SAM-dependent methyltransferase [Candidatus Aminicenantes bacterium]